MRLAGFEVLDRRRQRLLRRHSVIGRAVAPDAISQRSDLLAAMQTAGYVDSTFTPKMWDEGVTGRLVSYQAAPNREHLTPDLEASIDFPLHVSPGESENLRVVGSQHAKTNLR